LRGQQSDYERKRLRTDEYEKRYEEERRAESFQADVGPLCLAGNTHVEDEDEMLQTPISELFPDPTLAKFIAKTLNISDVHTAVSKARLDCIRSFYNYRIPDDEPRIQTLEGMQYLTSLYVLDLSDHDFDDLRPINGLRNLHTIYLSDTNVSDFSPLKNLPFLQSLSITYHARVDLSSLPMESPLFELKLIKNNIRDIGPLAALNNLSHLDIGGNEIRDLSPISHLVELISLDASNNEIEDLAPLQSLTKLKDLDLFWNNVRDITPLGQLVSLEKLFLGGPNGERNKITDFTPLAQLSHLIDFTLQGEDITRVPASVLSQLAALAVRASGLTDITLFTKFSNLIKLDLFYNNISDLTPLRTANFDNLQQLNLSANAISDLSPLSDVVFPQLVNIQIDGQRSMKWVSQDEASFKLENKVRDVDGTLIAPYRLLPEDVSRYEAPYMIWDITTSDHSILVAYSWTKEVEINNLSTEFSGTFDLIVFEFMSDICESGPYRPIECM